MAKEFKLTVLHMKELEDELKYLEDVRTKENANDIAEARSFGDLSENSEYEEARNEQARIYGRIAEIKNILSNAVIIDETEDNIGKIGLGCTIKVTDLDFEEDNVYTIVGSQEADPMLGKISDDSPFGRAMVGHVVGDVVTVEAPAGELHFKVLSVER